MESTGIGDYDEVSVNVYPNPAHDVLNVVLNGDVTSTIEVYSSLGQKVYSREGTGREMQIIISDWQKGLYFLKVYDEASGKQQTLSFIKH
jgi:hypothetical protein